MRLLVASKDPYPPDPAQGGSTVATTPAGTGAVANSALPEEHVVILKLGEEHYGIEIQSVQEIVRMQPITEIPGSEAWIEGITNLRGRVVPVVDLRRRCRIAASVLGPETRIVVVNSSKGMVGLIVDAVTEVIRIPGEHVEQTNEIVSQPANAYFRGIAKLDTRLVSLLDLEGVLLQDLDDADWGAAGAIAA
jgi:purine-binding chemotaxis protein CheW